jgi:galactose mutarotase-like enzyme
MKTSISTDRLEIVVKNRGAELCSIRHADGTEYLWQADPQVWARHAPILFPIVGALAGGVYQHGGQTYEMGQHGFARDSAFELAEQTESMLLYRMKSDETTRKMYPFEFELSVRYSVVAATLFIQYEVINLSAEVMPFSIGAHPAFSTELCKGDDVEDYCLAFSCAETADARLLGADHLLSTQVERVLDGERVLPLTRDMFLRDALIFLDLKSESISLRSRRHDKSLTVEFPGFPHLGIWAKPAAPYVCIEPWHGYVDPEGHDGVLAHKPGIIMLEPGESSSCAHTIRIDG